MSIPLSGTFEYAGIVPDSDIQSAGRWQLREQSEAEPSTRGGSLSHNRLVGLQPSLEITDGGVTSDVRVSPHRQRAAQSRAQPVVASGRAK